MILWCNQEPHLDSTIYLILTVQAEPYPPYSEMKFAVGPLNSLLLWKFNLPVFLCETAQSGFILKSETYISVTWTDTASLLTHCIGQSKSKSSLGSGGGQKASIIGDRNSVPARWGRNWWPPCLEIVYHNLPVDTSLALVSLYSSWLYVAQEHRQAGIRSMALNIKYFTATCRCFGRHCCLCWTVGLDTLL